MSDIAAPHLREFVYIWLFLIGGIVFVLIMLGVSRLLQPFAPSSRKLSMYECGEIVVGKPWVQFHIRYYIFAILFIIFDIETVFMFPWALIYKKLGLFGLVEMGVFIIILLLGLLYPWRKGVLKWV